MALLFESWWEELFFTVFVTIIIAFLHFKFISSKFWKKYNVFHLEPVFILGNIWNASITENLGFILANFYKKHKQHKLIGYWNFTKPALLVTDLDIIKNILTRDFNTFRDRRAEFQLTHDPLSGHLFNLSGNKWRNLRVKLTPTFTSGKMKMMFPTMAKCGEELQNYLEKTPEAKQSVEVKDILARFTTDIISSCAFGIETDSLNNPNSEFRRFGRKIFQATFKGLAKRIFLTMSPMLFNLFKLKFVPKDASDFFLGAVKDTMEFRETNKIRRNDFMDLLIQLKNKGKIEDVDSVIPNGKTDDNSEALDFTFDVAAAQAFVFFLAGFETSSTTLTFALYELALNSEIQRTLQKEIDEALKETKGQMTYDKIMEMQYLDKVIQETLRKHSPALFLMRECNKDYEIPELKATIPKKTQIMISVFGLHRDPDLFPDPEKFDPERFSPEEKAKRHNFATIPFGEGPRNCIGLRFGLIQSKLGLVSILSKFDVQTTKDTPVPLVYDKMSFVLSPSAGMYLKFIKRM